jgi:hypothetical protein
MMAPSASTGPHDLVTAAPDASSADWIAGQLMDWWSLPDGFMPVGAIVPQNFPAYVRILHPAQRAWSSGQVLVRWSEVAAHRGVKIGPETLWEEIAPSRDDAIVTAVPSEGSLPLEDARTLANILRVQTGRPDACSFAVWEGYSALEPHKRWPSAPRLHLPNRSYVLLYGQVEGIAQSFEPPPFRQSANLWWPEDRAWCVATEVDYCWTYVGGSRACIEAIMSSPTLEALPVRPDSRAAGRKPGQTP